MAEMNNQYNTQDTVSLIIGTVSLVLTVLLIKDNAIRIAISIVIFLVIVSVYLTLMFKEIQSNTLKIKKLNEKLNIYERLSKLEAKLDIKGDKK